MVIGPVKNGMVRSRSSGFSFLIRATASRLASALDPRSLVAFDFVGKRFAAGQSASESDRQTREYVGELGEPIRYGSDDILPLLY